MVLKWLIKVKVARDTDLHDVLFTGSRAGANRTAGEILCNGFGGCDVESVSVEEGDMRFPVASDKWVVITEFDDGASPSGFFVSGDCDTSACALELAGNVLKGSLDRPINSIFVGRAITLEDAG